MKKIFYLFLILLLLLIDLRSKENLTLVFKQKDENEFYEFILLELDNVNTSNLDIILKDIKVLKVYPSINKIYKNNIKNVYNYTNINDFKDSYLNELEKNGYYKDYNYYLVNPIKIEKILVYSSENTIRNKFEKFSIDTCININFRCIKIS